MDAASFLQTKRHMLREFRSPSQQLMVQLANNLQAILQMSVVPQPPRDLSSPLKTKAELQCPPPPA